MKYYIYGLVLETQFDFRYDLIAADAEERVDVRFEIFRSPVKRPGVFVRRLYESAYMRYGQPIFLIDEYSDRLILSFPGVVNYHFVDNELIEAEIIDEISDELIETHLLGLVMTFLLEIRGTIALHASAAVVEGGAVGFLASNKGGKSSFAASFVQQGNALLTDDILALDVGNGGVFGAPGYSGMRMLPDHARNLIGTTDTFPLVRANTEKLLIPLDAIGMGGISREAQPIKALFFPRRDDDSGTDIRIVRISESEAFRLILANGYIAGIAEAVGIRERRFAMITRLVRTTPMYQLRYPSGVENLPSVRRVILGQLDIA